MPLRGGRKEGNGGETRYCAEKAPYRDLMECRIGYGSRVLLRLPYDFDPLASDRRTGLKLTAMAVEAIVVLLLAQYRIEDVRK